MMGWWGWLKTSLTKMMYWRRGRLAGVFVNSFVSVVVLGVLLFSDTLEEMVVARDSQGIGGAGYLLGGEGMSAETQVSELPKGEIVNYRVKEGDTVSSIASQFGVSIDTIMWENNLKNPDAIKPMQLLRILPVTGVRVVVKRGETVKSLASKHQVDAQNIVDYPFNSFVNDEIFSLAAGQELMIPDGIKPKEIIIDTARLAVRTVAPVPGVVGEGSFIWPTTGSISQRFSWYHQAVDIAKADRPPIVAAARGTVVTAGWNSGGYGNYVIIDHGNGTRTLYAHMVNGSIVVKPGQVVSQGEKIGTMGSTGRSTGTHLHFEIIGSKGKLNPLTVLK